MADQINAECKIDDILEEYKVTPLSLCLYILEQYELEDGIERQDVYQDLLGSAWEDLRKAYMLNRSKV